MLIATRAQLGSRPFRTPPPIVPLAVRREVTIHYPGAGTPPRDLKAYRAWIERIHMDERGWRGVGYNYFVDANGNIGEGAGRDVVGAHSPPHNVDGIGVNIWTSNGVPTEAGKKAARELYEYLCRQAGRKLRIGWHGRDFPTECPGATLRAWAMAGMPIPGGTVATPITPAPEPKGILDMSHYRQWTSIKTKTKDNTWRTLDLTGKGAYSLAIDPGQALITVEAAARLPEGAGLQVRIYEVDYQKGTKTTRVGSMRPQLELARTPGLTYGTAVLNKRIAAGPGKKSRRIRAEVKITGATGVDVVATVRATTEN